MKRPQIESEYYIINSTIENRDQHKKQRIFLQIIEKGRKEIYITDNKLFCETMKIFLTDKCTHASNISLKQQPNVLYVDQELAEILNNFFQNSVDD